MHRFAAHASAEVRCACSGLTPGPCGQGLPTLPPACRVTWEVSARRCIVSATCHPWTVVAHTDTEGRLPTAWGRFIFPCRDIWPDEVGHLTPWVIDNLDMLARLVGMDLEFVEREARVGGGDFRADILARDGGGRSVIIENQFGPSDHGHFGQLITYACEHAADVVIWLAAGGRWGIPPAIRPEHRRALMALNRQFAGRIAFFGVEALAFSDPRPFGEPSGPVSPFLEVVVRPEDRLQRDTDRKRARTYRLRETSVAGNTGLAGLRAGLSLAELSGLPHRLGRRVAELRRSRRCRAVRAASSRPRYG
jgi:hypothetical protein